MYPPPAAVSTQALWRTVVRAVLCLSLLGFAGSSWAQCGAGGNLPANQWSLVSLACAPNTATVDGVWGDELGTANYGVTWLVFERDEVNDAYMQLGINDPVDQADAYWVLTLAGAGWNATPGTATPTTASADCPAAECFERALTPPGGAGASRFNMVGFPFPMAIPFQDVRVRTNTLGTLTPAQAAAQNVITDSFWLWNGNAYDVASSTTPGMTGSMQPYFGMFIEAGDGAIGEAPVLLIPIAAVNDPPDAVDDSLTVDEDASQTVLDSGNTSVLDNDTDPDGDTLSVTPVPPNAPPAAPTNAAMLTLNNDGSFEYEHDGSETTADSFDYEVCDNGAPQLCATATVDVTIIPVNDPPILDPIGDPTVDELDTLNFTATASDAENDTRTFSLVGAPGNASITAGGMFDFTPSENQGPGSFTFDVVVTDDGIPNESDSETITVTVNEVNEAPTFDSPNPTFGPINETIANGTAIGSAAASDVDVPANALSFSITAGNTGNAFAIDNNGDITVNDTSAVDFEAATAFNLTVEVDDNTGAANATATTGVTINLSDVAPAISDATFTIDEDIANTTLVGVVPNTGDDDSVSFTITAGDPNNAFAIDNDGNITVNDTTEIDFETTPQFVLTVNATDGTTPDNATITINVNDVAEPPVVNLDDANNGGNEPNFAATFNTTIGAPVAIVDNSLSVSDDDSTMLDSATVTITNVQDAPDELLAAAASGAIAAGDINYTAATGTLTITRTTTLADYAAVLRTLTYDNDAATPTLSPDRVITVTATDDSALTSAPVTATVDLIAGPVLDLDANDSTAAGDDFAGAFTEDAGAVAVVDSDVAIDSPSANLIRATFTLTNRPDGADEGLSVSGALPAGISVTDPYDNADGVLEITGSASAADYQTALQQVEYDNASDTPDTTDRSITVEIEDANNVTNPGDPTATLSVTAANDPPSAAAQAYDVTGNVPISVPAGSGLTQGFNDPEGDAIASVQVDQTATAGTVSAVGNDGSFTYTPPAGFTGVDTFTYTLTDDGTPAETSAAETVTLTVSDTIWFLDNSAGAGNGTLNMPFNTLAAFEAVNGGGGAGDPDAGDCLFLDTGGSDYTGGITLENTQRLIGEGATGGSLDTLCGITLAAHSNALPALAGGRPTLVNSAGNGITLASNNTVRGLDVGNTTGAGIFGNFGTLVLRDLAITGTGNILDLANGTLDAIVDTLSTTSAATAIRLNAVGGSLTVSDTASDTTISGATTRGIDIQNAPAGAAFSFADTSVSGAAGINLAASGSATTTFNSLAVTATAGAGLAASTGGTVNVGGATNTITATGGPALDLVNTTVDNGAAGGGITFSTLSSTSAASDGINLDNVTGSVTGNGGAIVNTGGAGVDINAQTGNFTFGGTIDNNGGRSVEVTGSGGTPANTIAFSGAIDDDGSGIHLDNNDQNTGATVRFSGGLDLDTGTNTAFNAVNGGTVEVLNTTVTNDIDTTTGTGVNIANTTIGANGVTFDSVSVNGATNGIVLDSTGTSGGLTVTGDGSTAGSGGTIQNTTSNGVSLTTTQDVALNFMNITGSDANGVLGNDVTGFTLNGSTVENNGDAVNEGALRFDQNLLGTATISNSTLRTSAEHNIEIINTSSTALTLNVTGSTISDTNLSGLGADGLLLETRNSANASVTVTDSAFSNNASDGIQVSAIDNSTANLTVEESTGTSSFSNGARGLNLSAATNADLTFSVTDTDFSDFSPSLGEEAINLALVSTSTMSSSLTGTIDGNVFSSSGGGVGVDLRGDGVATLAIRNNAMTSAINREVIDIITGDAAGDVAVLNLTALNNTLTSQNRDALFIEALEATSLCMNIRSNTATPGSGDDAYVIFGDATTGAAQLESGATDCGGVCANATAHITSNNTGTPVTVVDVDLVALGTCPIP